MNSMFPNQDNGIDFFVAILSAIQWGGLSPACCPRNVEGVDSIFIR